MSSPKSFEAGGIGDTRLAEREAKKQAEISTLAKQYNIFRPVIEEIRNLYDRLDTSGDNRIARAEFRLLVDWLCNKSNRCTANDVQFKRMWAEVNGASQDSAVDFTEFCGWLVSKYPAVKTMRASEIK